MLVFQSCLPYKLNVSNELIILYLLNVRKDNVLQLWSYLLELLQARRMRLELCLRLQKVFQEMLYVLDWMDEIKVKEIKYFIIIS